MKTNFLPNLQRIPLPLLVAGAKALFGGFQAIKAGEINPDYNDENVRKNLGMAQSLYNGRMAGAVNQEKNIANAQQNQINNINRTATDASQALALTTGTQGTANQAYNQLGIQELQNKYRAADVLSNAYTQMNNQLMNKYQMDTQAKAATNNAAFQNIFGGVNDIGSINEMGKQKEEMNGMWKDYMNIMSPQKTMANNLPPLTYNTPQQQMPPLTYQQPSMPQQQPLPPLTTPDVNLDYNTYFGRPIRGLRPKFPINTY
jgi:hypothetical protein